VHGQRVVREHDEEHEGPRQRGDGRLPRAETGEPQRRHRSLGVLDHLAEPALACDQKPDVGEEALAAQHVRSDERGIQCQQQEQNDRVETSSAGRPHSGWHSRGAVQA